MPINITPADAGKKAQEHLATAQRLAGQAVDQAKIVNTVINLAGNRILAGPPRGTKKQVAQLAGTVRYLRAALSAWSAAAKLARKP